MGALWQLPVIYFCENNGYAITTSLALSHGQPSIAARASAYGIPGVVVDGQDVTAVFEVTDAAVKRARRGEGPTLIEAKTYRYDEHNVGLLIPGKPYRPPEEVEEYRTQRDPVALFRRVSSAERGWRRRPHAASRVRWRRRWRMRSISRRKVRCRRRKAFSITCTAIPKAPRTAKQSLPHDGSNRIGAKHAREYWALA